MNDEQELKAIRTVKNLFKGVDGDEIARTDVKLSDKTFYNYSPLIQKYGLVEMVTDDGLGKKILAIRLTEKGKMIVAGQKPNSVNPTESSLSLDAVGEYIDRFNRQTKYWELRLVPKEVVNHK